MTEENISQQVDQQPVEEAGKAAPAEQPKKAVPAQKKRKRLITLGVVAAIVVVAGAGFWVWHEQPSFCNAICHAPQDPHNATYEAVSGQPAVDKWGNAVADAGDMLVVAHKEQAGMVCLDCHEPTMGQQISEGMHWVTGNYKYPLDERSLTDLNQYLKRDNPDEFCLNAGCHNMTRDDLARATAGAVRNPHVTEVNHAQLECTDCHKAHRQSVQACSRCHDDTEIPDGWLSAEQAKELTSVSFNF